VSQNAYCDTEIEKLDLIRGFVRSQSLHVMGEAAGEGGIMEVIFPRWIRALSKCRHYLNTLSKSICSSRVNLKALMFCRRAIRIRRCKRNRLAKIATAATPR
jgi:hypothetical protein